MAKLKSHCIILYEGDFDKIADLHNSQAGPVIRDLVHKHIEALEARLDHARKRASHNLPPAEID